MIGIFYILVFPLDPIFGWKIGCSPGELTTYTGCDHNHFHSCGAVKYRLASQGYHLE